MENSIENSRKEPDKASLMKVKNKELTKRRLIHAIGTIIQTEGFTGLGTNKIAKQAGVHKKLIYRYFGSTDRLIEEYVIEKDFWMLKSEQLGKQTVEEVRDLQASITGILENQFDFFFREKEMQQLIIWEISRKSELMKSISRSREHFGEKFLILTDKHFEGSGINFRALSAILSAGIYYLVMHADVSPYCGIDIRESHDREELKRTLRQLIENAFKDAKKPD